MAKDNTGSGNPEVILRLRAVMHEYALDTQKKLGDVCGASISTVNNWLLRDGRGHMPTVAHMSLLCEATGLTLDWVYRGKNGAADPKSIVRLNRRVEMLRDAN